MPVFARCAYWSKEKDHLNWIQERGSTSFCNRASDTQYLAIQPRCCIVLCEKPTISVDCHLSCTAFARSSPLDLLPSWYCVHSQAMHQQPATLATLAVACVAIVCLSLSVLGGYSSRLPRLLAAHRWDVLICNMNRSLEQDCFFAVIVTLYRSALNHCFVLVKLFLITT